MVLSDDTYYITALLLVPLNYIPKNSHTLMMMRLNVPYFKPYYNNNYLRFS